MDEQQDDSISVNNGSSDSAAEAPYDPAMAALAAFMGRGRGRGRGRGGGGVAIAGIAELDASLGRPPATGAGAGGGKPFPPASKRAGGAEKDFRGPEGLFKKGDWTCTVCGNVNWERRTTCNKCQNQKPNAISTDEVSLVKIMGCGKPDTVRSQPYK